MQIEGQVSNKSYTPFLLVGGGNMGYALVKGMIRCGAVGAADIHVVEPQDERRAFLTEDLGAATYSAASEVTVAPKVVLFAVKPQVFTTVAPQYSHLVSEHTLTMSCMAGITVETINNAFPVTARVVRVMPNLPALIGQGMSTFTCSTTVLDEDVEFAYRVFSSVGKAIRVDDDKMVDAGTAVSGSGPGYVACFIEHMMSGAISLGFSESEARQLVTQTFKGTADLLLHSDIKEHELRERVSSPQGTTLAGLSTFQAQGLHEAIHEGINAAFNRARELSE